MILSFNSKKAFGGTLTGIVIFIGIITLLSIIGSAIFNSDSNEAEDLSRLNNYKQTFMRKSLINFLNLPLVGEYKDMIVADAIVLNFDSLKGTTCMDIMREAIQNIEDGDEEENSEKSLEIELNENSIDSGEENKKYLLDLCKILHYESDSICDTYSKTKNCHIQFALKGFESGSDRILFGSNNVGVEFSRVEFVGIDGRTYAVKLHADEAHNMLLLE